MARPTEDEVEQAFELVQRWGVLSTPDRRLVLERLREAVRPRPVWPVKEVAEYLDVRPENVRPEKLRGLPVPAQEFPRPTARHPEKTMRLFYADEIEAYRAVLEATPRRRNARKRAVKG